MKELSKAINSQSELQEKLQGQLVQSASDILNNFVFWDETTQRFVPKEDVPDLVIFPTRFATMAAAGALRLARESDIPLPAMLEVSLNETHALGAYQAKHEMYEELLRTNPDEFDRLKQAEVERVGEDKSLLSWIEHVTGELEPGDEFPFAYIDLVDPMTATDNDIVGGFKRHIDAQIRDDAEPNPLQQSVQAIRNHPNVQKALHEPAKKNRAHVSLLIDTRDLPVANALAPIVLGMKAGQPSPDFDYRSSESMSVFPDHSTEMLWVKVLHHTSDLALLTAAIEETVMAHQDQILTKLKIKH